MKYLPKTNRRYKYLKLFDENIKKVPIYQSELDIINKFDNFKLRRLLFIILVWSKFSKYKNTLCEIKTITRLAGITGIKRDIEILLEDVTFDGFWLNREELDGYLLHVKFKSRDKIYYEVLFREQDESKEPALWVEDIEDCVNIFPKIFFEGKYCKSCGCEIREIKGNNQKYCVECSQTLRKKYVSQKVREYRKKKDM